MNVVMYRLPKVKELLGYKSNGTIYNQVRDGLFTTPVPIGLRAVGWPNYEVAAIINARIAGEPVETIRKLVKQLHAQRVNANQALRLTVVDDKASKFDLKKTS